VLIAGLVIWVQPSWHAVDPAVTLLFCAIVFWSTVSVIQSSISVLLEEVPPHVSWNQVYRNIVALTAVERVHDLHIWSISDGVPALSVHCFLKKGGDPRQALRDVYAVCTRHNIHHATIQIQCGGNDNNDEVEEECITCRHDIPCDHPGATDWTT